MRAIGFGLTTPLCVQMYLRFEPTSNSSDSQEDLYQEYGLGTWLDTQLPSAKKQPTPKKVTVSIPSASMSQPRSNPTNANGTPSAPQDAPAVTAPLSSRASDENKAIPKTGGSSLLAYRDPKEDSSDDEEVLDVKDVKQSLSARGIDQEDEDNMDPTSAYVTAKLRLTSLERMLGLASKSNKKGVKSKPKATGSASNPAELQEYEHLDARIKECKHLSVLLVLQLLSLV